ncbi:MAG TPA: electron transfer flavoprotein subunit alpha/FixB family protein [Candidatus Polarisedimenticolaceae bacterium]
MATVLVLAERRGGEIKRPTLETLTQARRLAGNGGQVAVLAFGSGAAESAPLLGGHGADRVIACEDPRADVYLPEAYAATLAAAARSSGADIVLAPATALGKDVVARAGAILATGVLSDVVEIEWTGNALRGKRPVYSGKAFAWASIPEARPAMATLRPNVFPSAAQARPAEVESIALQGPTRVRAVALEKPAEAELDVAEATIVVSGGRGLKAPENFALVRDLAKALGAAVGASRAVVDAGWIDHAHQVGQTGKVVSPSLYVACGISGAIQHLAGMSSAKVIVAVNKDAEAPIFKIATYGIVGDLFEVVPKITEEVRKLKQQ